MYQVSMIIMLISPITSEFRRQIKHQMQEFEPRTKTFKYVVKYLARITNINKLQCELNNFAV